MTSELMTSRESEGSVLVRMLRYWPLTAYIFLVVYSPPVGPAPDAIKLLFLATVPVLLAVHYSLSGRPGFGALLKASRSSSLAVWILIASVYAYFVISLSGQEISSFSDTRLVQNSTALLVLANVLFIIDLLRRRGFGAQEAFQLLLWLGTLQAAFALASFVVPQLKAISDSLYEATGSSNEFVLADRIYGISSDFTYGTQVYHGSLAGLAVFFAVEGRRRDLLHVPSLLFITFLNGRTGLLAFLVVALIAVSFGYLRKGNVLGVIMGGLGIVGLLAAGLALLRTYVPATYLFVDSFIQDTQNIVFNDTATGNYSVLTNEITMIPDGWGLFFGEGTRLYALESGRTDIGLTNDLFVGGLIYLAMAYIPLVCFIFQGGRVSRLLSIQLLAVFVVANLKGEFLHSSVLLFLVIFIVSNQVFGDDGQDEEGCLTADPGEAKGLQGRGPIVAARH